MSDKLQPLITLMLTSERGLEAYCKQQYPDGSVDVAQLERVRALVLEITTALARPHDTACWDRIDAASAAVAEARQRAATRAAAARAAASATEQKATGPATAPRAAVREGPALAAPAPRARPFPERAASTSSPWAAESPCAPASPEVTSMVDSHGAGGEALPFRPGRAAVPIADRAEVQALDVGGTAMLDPDAPLGAALPFSAPVASRTEAGELSLEGYAQLCAECAEWPDHTAAINDRHGLPTAAARGRVDLGWQKRMAAEPELRAAWQSLFDEHRKRLRSG